LPKSADQSSPTPQPQQLQFSLTDEADVTFTGLAADYGINFVDEGYMPVNMKTLSGGPLHVPGGLDGVYLHYTGVGEQYVDGANGTINYTGLTYDLVGYKGKISFVHDSSGAVVITGQPKQTFEIAHGGMDSGKLVLDGTGVGGTVNVSVLIGNQQVGTMDIAVHHGLNEIGPLFNNPYDPTMQTGLTLEQGQVTATFYPKVA